MGEWFARLFTQSHHFGMSVMRYILSGYQVMRQSTGKSEIMPFPRPSVSNEHKLFSAERFLFLLSNSVCRNMNNVSVKKNKQKTPATRIRLVIFKPRSENAEWFLFE